MISKEMRLSPRMQSENHKNCNVMFSLLHCAQAELSEELGLTSGRWIALLDESQHHGIPEVSDMHPNYYFSSYFYL